MLIKLFKIYLQKLRNYVLGDFRSKKLSQLIVKRIIKYNKKKIYQNCGLWYWLSTKSSLFRI